VFAEDRGRSRRVTLDEWRSRPLWERIQERFAWVMQKQL
jgi:phosphatidylserine/phosphatidylglycerophosphate/cardiolipin synthase-like enzyme